MLSGVARDLAQELKAGDRVLLDGEMGAGKTTFARYLLLGLGVEQPPEGSPTFAIVHEYSLGASSSGARGVAHADLYRIRSEAEIEDAGLTETFWDPERISIVEWATLWPEFEAALLKASDSHGKTWRVKLEIDEKDPELRHVRIFENVT